MAIRVDLDPYSGQQARIFQPDPLAQHDVPHQRVLPLKEGRAGDATLQRLFQNLSGVLGQIRERLMGLPFPVHQLQILADGGK